MERCAYGMLVFSFLYLLSVVGCSKQEPPRIEGIPKSELVAKLQAAVAAPAMDPELAAAIREAITMLEGQQFEPFLDRFVPADEKVFFLQGTSLAARAQAFAGRPRQKMLGKLKIVQAATPRMNEARTEALFNVAKVDPTYSQFKMIRVDGKWFIRN